MGLDITIAEAGAKLELADRRAIFDFLVRTHGRKVFSKQAKEVLQKLLGHADWTRDGVADSTAVHGIVDRYADVSALDMTASSLQPSALDVSTRSTVSTSDVATSPGKPASVLDVAASSVVKVSAAAASPDEGETSASQTSVVHVEASSVVAASPASLAEEKIPSPPAMITEPPQRPPQIVATGVVVQNRCPPVIPCSGKHPVVDAATVRGIAQEVPVDSMILYGCKDEMGNDARKAASCVDRLASNMVVAERAAVPAVAESAACVPDKMERPDTSPNFLTMARQNLRHAPTTASLSKPPQVPVAEVPTLGPPPMRTLGQPPKRPLRTMGNLSSAPMCTTNALPAASSSGYCGKPPATLPALPANVAGA